MRPFFHLPLPQSSEWWANPTCWEATYLCTCYLQLQRRDMQCNRTREVAGFYEDKAGHYRCQCHFRLIRNQGSVDQCYQIHCAGGQSRPTLPPPLFGQNRVVTMMSSLYTIYYTYTPHPLFFLPGTPSHKERWKCFWFGIRSPSLPPNVDTVSAAGLYWLAILEWYPLFPEVQ